MSEPGEANPHHQPGDMLPDGADSLPSPEKLAQYESVLTGLAERIVSNWERSQAHRHNHQKQTIANEKIALETYRQAARWSFLVRIWSLVIAAIVIVGGLFAGIVLTIMYGWSPASLVSLLAALAGLVAVIYGNVRRDDQNTPGG